MADPIGIDRHKTCYVPYTSSMFLCKDAKDLRKLPRDPDDMLYLFQHGHYHPGAFTLELSRPGGSALSALANLKSLGRRCHPCDLLVAGSGGLAGAGRRSALHVTTRARDSESWITIQVATSDVPAQGAATGRRPAELHRASRQKEKSHEAFHLPS
ncbi:hypothetical protein WMF37_20960 [Sorangium sp. So ce291]|uniref:hypothetical protein n=1 Tax=Sorangium sp. So ce291 TaxID=3133294 RepID=UPI003F61F762